MIAIQMNYSYGQCQNVFYAMSEISLEWRFVNFGRKLCKDAKMKISLDHLTKNNSTVDLTTYLKQYSIIKLL